MDTIGGRGTIATMDTILLQHLGWCSVRLLTWRTLYINAYLALNNRIWAEMHTQQPNLSKNSYPTTEFEQKYIPNNRIWAKIHAQLPALSKNACPTTDFEQKYMPNNQLWAKMHAQQPTLSKNTCPTTDFEQKRNYWKLSQVKLSLRHHPTAQVYNE